MKRVLPFLFLCVLVPVLFVVPVLGAELAGGYYITGDSSLGKGLTFYVPADYAAGSLTYDSSGNLFNLTSSSIYLYCPDYPEYTIYASRFSGFQYRRSSGYDYVDLRLSNVTDTNVEIFEDSPAPAVNSNFLLVMILAVVIVGVGAFVLLRR